MTTFHRLDEALAAQGWRYDAQSECFMNGERVVDYREVLALVPGMTEDELRDGAAESLVWRRAKHANSGGQKTHTDKRIN